MGHLLYRICQRLSPGRHAGAAGSAHRAHAAGSADHGVGTLAVLAGLAFPLLAPALPIEPPGPPAGSAPLRSASPAAERFPDLPGGLDPAPWGSFFTEGGATPGATRSRSAAAQSIGQRTPYVGESYRETLLATPLGEEILRFALEVFSPTVDALGRLHVSFLGRGDFVLSRSDPDPPPRSLDVPAFDAGAGSEAARWDSPLTPAPLHPAAHLDGYGPLTVGEFLVLLAREVIAFATHPLTLLAAVLGAVGYVVVRFALERSGRRGHHRSHAHRHHHGSSRHHHAHTRHGHARHGPSPRA